MYIGTVEKKCTGMNMHTGIVEFKTSVPVNLFIYAP
jgi:hypothetical protein